MAVNIGEINMTGIRMLDDNLPIENRASGAKKTPIMRMRMPAATFQADGALHPRIMVDNISISLEVDVHHIEGTGEFAFEIDFFNPVVSLWEPILERFSPYVTIKKEQAGFMLDIDAKKALQINFSGRMIDSFVSGYATFLRRSDDAIHKFSTNRTPPPSSTNLDINSTSDGSRSSPSSAFQTGGETRLGE